ncbi:MAG: nuclear transport factor 2 family protein [Nitrospirae bacterium]|nr:nuclear transport factor 2 family protein [Nitrospirota bacterium]
MNPVQTPITGQEDQGDLSLPFHALVQFYHAFNAGNMTVMAENWAQSDEIAMDNPLGGIKRGWEEIKAVYERIFHGSARVYVEFYDYTIHETQEMFYAVGRERGEFRLGETVIPLAIRTSRIFRLMDGRWRQVHHHGSIDDPGLLARYQSAIQGGQHAVKR